MENLNAAPIGSLGFQPKFWSVSEILECQVICANILIFCTYGAASRMMLVPLAVRSDYSSDGVVGQVV